MKRALLLAGAFVLAGCESFDLAALRGGGGNDGAVTVRSVPEGAFLTFSDGTICQTPCKVSLTEPLDLTVAAAGHAPLNTVIDQTTPPEVTFELSPVGRAERAEDVDLAL